MYGTAADTKRFGSQRAPWLTGHDVTERCKPRWEPKKRPKAGRIQKMIEGKTDIGQEGGKQKVNNQCGYKSRKKYM